MRLALLLAFLGAVCALAPPSTFGANPPRYHNSEGAGGVYTSRPYANDYPNYRPLWVFYDYPRGIPENTYDPKTPGYRYYPYSIYRSSPPQDRYDRNKSQRYPVR